MNGKHLPIDDGQPVARIRLVAKVVREVLAERRFEDYTTVVEAVKCRCARYRIPDYERLVLPALRLVGSNTPFVTGRQRDLLRREPPRRMCHVELSRADATAILARLAARR